MSTTFAVEVEPLKALGFDGVHRAVYEWLPTPGVYVLVADDDAPRARLLPSKNSNVPAALGETPAVRVRAVPSTCGDDGVTVRLVAVWAVMSTTFAVEVEPTNAVESAGVKCTVYEWLPTPGVSVLVADDDAAPSEYPLVEELERAGCAGGDTCREGQGGAFHLWRRRSHRKVVVVGTAVTGGGEMVTPWQWRSTG